MRRIEQRSLCAVVELEHVVAPLFHAHQHAGIFGAERASRLCPEFRRIADRQALEAPVDRVEIMFEVGRSEEHTSELQSLMRSSYAVFCLKKKNCRHGTEQRKELHRRAIDADRNTNPQQDNRSLVN